MYNKFDFTLDSIIYSCDSDGKDDILINLPKGTPNEILTFKANQTDEKSTILVPTDQVEIKLFLTVATEKIPKVVIRSAKHSTVQYANTLDIQPKAMNLLTFITSDGGASWLVKNQVYSTSPTSPPISGGITDINGDKGPSVILDASNIHLSGLTGPTIIQQLNDIQESINQMEVTITSDVLDEVVKILPDKIQMIVKNDTEIVAELI